MTNKRIRQLPIMEGQKLIGMVSIGDVVKAQLDHVEVEAHALSQYITGGYS
jgi:predicted transcriptional regulator